MDCAPGWDGMRERGKGQGWGSRKGEEERREKKIGMSWQGKVRLV